jgi:hypothetical protein
MMTMINMKNEPFRRSIEKNFTPPGK